MYAESRSQIPAAALWFCLCVAVAGCSESPRQSVEGTVTLDGQPLDKGDITFFPLAGSEGPAAGARVENGKFQVAKARGTFAGNFRVEIAKYEDIPGMFQAGKDGPIPVSGNVLPARYHEQSELTAEIKEGERNELLFELISE